MRECNVTIINGLRGRQRPTFWGSNTIYGTNPDILAVHDSILNMVSSYQTWEKPMFCIGDHRMISLHIKVSLQSKGLCSSKKVMNFPQRKWKRNPESFEPMQKILHKEGRNIITDGFRSTVTEACKQLETLVDKALYSIRLPKKKRKHKPVKDQVNTPRARALKQSENKLHKELHSVPREQRPQIKQKINKIKKLLKKEKARWKYNNKTKAWLAIMKTNDSKETYKHLRDAAGWNRTANPTRVLDDEGNLRVGDEATLLMGEHFNDHFKKASSLDHEAKHLTTDNKSCFLINSRGFGIISNLRLNQEISHSKKSGR